MKGAKHKEKSKAKKDKKKNQGVDGAEKKDAKPKVDELEVFH